VKSLKQKQQFERMGRRAEWLAALYLMAMGYRVLARRFRTKSGEIDLLARKRDVVIAVEVKQRLTRAAANESISAESERRISNALEQFIAARKSLHHCGLRCDVSCVQLRVSLYHL